MMVSNDHSLIAFTNKVNAWLNEGWVVVPGTTASVVTLGRDGLVERHSVVLERLRK